MAHGDNHAKQIVITQAKELADKLQNGNSGCLKTQGRAIALIVQMITPLYEAEFITAKECIAKHKNFKQIRQTKTARIKVGPIELEGPVTSALLINFIPLICCGILGFVLGKSQGWW